MSGLNFILILVAAFVAVFLQSSVNVFRFLTGAQLDLLPALMAYAALTSGISTITFLAVLGGLCFDTLSANPLGVSVLPLLVAGMLAHHRRELILRTEARVQFVVGLFCCGLVPLLALVSLWSLGETPLVGVGFLWQWLVMSVAGACLTPVIFTVFQRLSTALHYQPMPETSFRQDRQIKRGRD